MINEEIINKVSRIIDDSIDFTKIIDNKILGFIAEKGDYLLISTGIKYLNENYSQYIPELVTKNIEGISQLLIDEKYEEIIKYETEYIDSLVDLKFLEDDDEAQFIAINLSAAVKFIKYFASKRQKR